jgi:hypothetical protein
VYDATQDYNASFALSGILFLIAGFIGVGLQLVQSYQQRQIDRENINQKESIAYVKTLSKDGTFIPALPPLHEESEESKQQSFVLNRDDERFKDTVLDRLAEEEEVMGGV